MCTRTALRVGMKGDTLRCMTPPGRSCHGDSRRRVRCSRRLFCCLAMILLLCEIYRTTASSRNTQCHVFFSKKQDRTRKYPEIKFSGISQLFSSFSSCTISIIHGASTHIGLIPRYIPHGEIGKCRVSRRPLLVVNLRICNFTKFRAFSNFHVSAKFPIYTVKSVLENTDVTPLRALAYCPTAAAAGRPRGWVNFFS